MKENKPISHFIAGLIIAAVMIVYSLALYFMGMEQNRAMGWISYGILIIGLIIFINQYGKAKNHYVTFGNLFSYGFKATAIISLLLVAFSLIFFMVFPEFKDKIMEGARAGMEEQGKMSEEQIDQAIEMFNKNFLLFTIGGALLMYIILGCIGSLIGAAVTKKKPVNPMDQMN